jgi:hypothetical protein
MKILFDMCFKFIYNKAMTNISKSPERHTFQAEKYVERCLEADKEPNPDYLDLYKSARQQDEENMVDPKWQKDNLEYDLRSTEWILEKVRGDDVYAQNLYAAMCNNEFIKREMWPILKDQRWSCSWRHSGGIVADMQEKGDYIDWYCSGIRDTRTLSASEIANLTEQEQLAYKAGEGYVGEGCVTDEIKNDLYKLGWLVIESKDDML